MGHEEMLAGRLPFELHTTGEDAVLCLHGFTGSPGIYRKLTKQLHAAGFAVSAPLLPGHGTQPTDMVQITVDDWLQAAETAYSTLKARYSKVHLVGLSLGGALACALAADHPELHSLVLLAPAFAVNPWITQRLGLSEPQPAADSDRIVPLPTRQPDGGEMDECIFGYNGFPVAAMLQLRQAGQLARQCCSAVHTPTCVIYTAADRVVDPAACEQMAQTIPGLQQLIRLPKSEHNILLGCDRLQAGQQILQFLCR